MKVRSLICTKTALNLLLVLLLLVVAGETSQAKTEQDYKNEALSTMNASFGAFTANGYTPRESYTYDLVNQGADTYSRQYFYKGNEYAIYAAGDNRVKDIDLYLEDDEGNIIAQDITPKAFAMVVFTPQYSGTYFVIMRNYDCTPYQNAWLVATYAFR